MQSIQEMIVVNIANQKRTVNLKDFYEIKGLLNQKSNSLIFDWRKDHGIINGNVDQIKEINEIFNENQAFVDYSILLKRNYDYEKCTKPFENPCPYYQAALTSLMMPSLLALLTFFCISCCAYCSCCSCCSCCLIQGMYIYRAVKSHHLTPFSIYGVLLMKKLFLTLQYLF